jgi:terminase large subunit-like protein
MTAPALVPSASTPYLPSFILPAGFVPGVTPLITTQDARTGEVLPFYTPTPKQCELHFCLARNAMYGGRAGTGKSVALRMDGHARCLSRPGYRALLVRRLMTELRDTHLDKLSTEAEMIGARYRASETTVVYSHPNGPPSRFRFGHVEDEQALKQYLSSEFDVIYFDELATFTEFMYTFLSSRLRSSKPGVIPLTRAGSNPGMTWIPDYFIYKEVDTEKRNPAYNPDHYHFIPATIADNPHVDQAEYNLRLDALPTEALRKMYRDGDWSAVEGQFYEEWREFKQHNDEAIPWHVITELPYFQGKPCLLTEWIQIVRAIDWGYSDEEPGVCLWFALLPDGSAIGFQEYKFSGTKPEDVAKRIREMSVFDKRLHGRGGPMKIRYTVGDPQMFAQRTGESIAETFAKKKNGGIGMIEGDNSYPAGFVRVHSWLKTEFYSTKPYPALQFLRPSSSHGWSGCPYTIRSFPACVKDKLDPDKIASHQPDHGPDATKYFVMSRPSPSRESSGDHFKALPPAIRAAIMRGHKKPVTLGSESVRKH